MALLDGLAVWRARRLLRQGQFDSLLVRYGNSTSNAVREIVAETHLLKEARDTARDADSRITALSEAGHHEEAIEALRELEIRFSDSAHPPRRVIAAIAMVDRGAALLEIGRADEAMAVLRGVETEFGQDASPLVTDPVMRSLVERGRALASARRHDEAIEIFDRVAQAGPGDPVAEVRSFADPVDRSFGVPGSFRVQTPPRSTASWRATAAVERAQTLAAAGRTREAVGAADAVIDHWTAVEPALVRLYRRYKRRSRRWQRWPVSVERVERALVAPVLAAVELDLIRDAVASAKTIKDGLSGI